MMHAATRKVGGRGRRMAVTAGGSERSARRVVLALAAPTRKPTAPELWWSWKSASVLLLSARLFPAGGRS